MNLTEEDATLSWCPFVRLSDMGEAYNRRGPNANLLCVGSACMAWRWQPLMADEAYLAAVKKATEQHHGQGKAAAHVNANRAAYGLPDKPFRGYCGLAGEPRA